MIQTAGVLSAAKQRQNQERLLQQSLLVPLGDGEMLLNRLKGMGREELLKVFSESRAPTPEELSEIICYRGNAERNSEKCGKSNDDNNNAICEWDGVLLDNNGKIMNLVSGLLTHGLFGGIGLPWRLMGPSSKAKGRWSGKAFGTLSSPGSPSVGTNRFVPAKSTACFRRHSFDFSISDSKLLPGTSSLRLEYKRHQSLPVSLWSSMVDEIRVVELLPRETTCNNENDSDNEDLVLIGMGWMGWSGGSLNCSPFLLEPSRPITKTARL
eukprot:CAMPEP_0201129408 /NCGR_PEP_ID=MMETSP0850-20130426/36856_1 /ASSEMBLY_ACC=CAM_ASM_000622 /TAXON_ID=183588 /ORGANISM="Pseudo-nitzschia fraudulenta, Strain WWA7" /LENGTH=267 /DNA_ID=CAMNT_0047398873 /DNA_START=131 /DNA_END=934 /DNA_ORIENTATION=-